MKITNGVLELGGAIQLRGGTAEILAAENPLLSAREIMIETDTGKMKIGDGVGRWNGLEYTTSTASGSSGSSNDNNILSLPDKDGRLYAAIKINDLQYVVKNGQYISVSPEIDVPADMVLTVGEKITPFQFTGTNMEVNA